MFLCKYVKELKEKYAWNSSTTTDVLNSLSKLIGKMDEFMAEWKIEIDCIAEEISEEYNEWQEKIDLKINEVSKISVQWSRDVGLVKQVTELTKEGFDSMKTFFQERIVPRKSTECKKLHDDLLWTLRSIQVQMGTPVKNLKPHCECDLESECGGNLGNELHAGKDLRRASRLVANSPPQ